MQNATRGQLRGVNFKFISVCIPGPHDCSQTALDRRKDSGKREAAFFAILIAFGRQHHWINQGDALFGILTAGTVHYKQALRNTNLHGGQAHAGRRIHRFKHVRDKLLQVVIKYRHRIGRHIQYRIRPLNYFQ